VPPFTATVDGVAGASEDNVRPNGEIVYEFTLLPDIFQWIDQMLISHSPVKSGRYQASHVLLADGSPCDVAAPPTNASQYVFMDTQPYARKIEGLNGKKPESSAAPNGVYEGIAMLAAARFGNVAKIAFGLKPLPGGLASSWATSPSAKALARRHHRRAHALQWLASQAVVAAVKARLQQNWTTTPVIFPNDPAVTSSNDKAFVTVQFPTAVEQFIGMAAVGSRTLRESGTFRLVVSVPRGRGIDTALGYCVTLASLFRLKDLTETANTVVCFEANQPPIDSGLSDNGAYWEVPFSVRYQYDFNA
jgi:Bacteriophage related domain of unknown function